MCDTAGHGRRISKQGYANSLGRVCSLIRSQVVLLYIPFRTMAGTFEDLERKIMAVSTFVEEQKADLEEKTYKAVKATQLKQLLDDIAVFSGLTAENATQVTAILRRGPWEQEDRAVVAGCLSNVLANPGRKQGAVIRRANQDLLSFDKFLSQSEVAILADNTVSVHAKADAVASRMIKIQLWLASEQAYSEVLKTVQAAGMEMSTAQDKYAFLQLLKKMVRARVKKFPKTISLPNPFPATPEDRYIVAQKPVLAFGGVGVRKDI